MAALRMFGARGVTALPVRNFQYAGSRMISGIRSPTLLQTQRKHQENSGHGFRGCVPKPFDGWNRGFASYPQGSGPGKGNPWLVALSSAVLGIAGAAYAYTQSETGKIWDNPFIVNCAKADDNCDCVERKCGDSECLRKMDREEELIAKANQDLEKALKDVKPKAVDYTEAALKAYCEATELIKQFMDKVYCAMENDNMESPMFEEVWCDIYDTAVKRCEKVKDAIQKARCAWELLCRLREVIEAGKACKYTSCNPLLKTAEQALLCAESELVNARNKMECVQSESRLVEQYRQVVEDFRADLKASVQSDCLTDTAAPANECGAIITNAYKKVLRIQKELAQVEVCTGQVPERLQATLC